MTALLLARPGDRITVVNGDLLPEPLTVAAVLAASVVLVPPRPSVVEWRLYADQHDVEFEGQEPTPEPAPAPVEPAPAPRPRRPAVRVVGAVRMVSEGGGAWTSEDGRYIAQAEVGTTFCEEPHPMRVTRAGLASAQADPYRDWALPILDAVRRGARGWMCPGIVEHYYDCWTVTDTGGQFERTEIVDSFGGALAQIADWERG